MIISNKKEHLVSNLQTHQNYTNQLKSHFNSELDRIKEKANNKVETQFNNPEGNYILFWYKMRTS